MTGKYGHNVIEKYLKHPMFLLEKLEKIRISSIKIIY